ncbi:MAG: cupin domain-containing protein [Gammaproteobacteria bacterium]|nr:MAG: cupin domain-containing protein [Gammaproteobacteria bacterium]
MSDRITLSRAIAALAGSSDPSYAVLLERGTLEIAYYKPELVDQQKPHQQDEVYVVASGSGYFMNGETRVPFEPGEVLFVPAGVVHRFEDFSEDFATWVLFYGPEGGEG